MNFNGYNCPKCGKRVVKDNYGLYKCRCGWSYRERGKNYAVQLRKRLEQQAKNR